MALFRKSKNIPYVNGNPTGNKDTPFETTQPYSEISIDFLNAIAVDPIMASIVSSLKAIDVTNVNKQNIHDKTNPNIPIITNLPTLAEHRGIDEKSRVIYSPVPIFVGSTDGFSKEFLYFNPEIRSIPPSQFYASTGCDKVFLFGHINPKISSNRGFGVSQVITGLKIPYSHATTKTVNETDTQLIFINQNKDYVELRSFEMSISNMGRGIGLITETPQEIDTWYDGGWNSYNQGNNVSVGYSNIQSDISKISNRYNWSFGSIFLTKSLGSMISGDLITPPSKYIFNIPSGLTDAAKINIYAFIKNYFATNAIQTVEIKQFYEENDKLIIITPSDIDKEFFIEKMSYPGFNLYDSDENFGLREISYVHSSNTIKLIGWEYTFDDGDDFGIDEKRANVLKRYNGLRYIKSPVDYNKVYGRQLYSYFMKTIEEGKCIRLNDVDGTIEVSVDFLYNGNCCQCVDTIVSSSSSSSSCTDSSESSSSYST